MTESNVRSMLKLYSSNHGFDFTTLYVQNMTESDVHEIVHQHPAYIASQARSMLKLYSSNHGFDFTTLYVQNMTESDVHKIVHDHEDKQKLENTEVSVQPHRTSHLHNSTNFEMEDPKPDTKRKYNFRLSTHNSKVKLL